jgi:hypothetical protein
VYAPIASVLPTVLFVAMILGGVVGVMSLLARKDPYEEIERGGLSLDRDDHAGAEQGAFPDAIAQRNERELEIRQMLEARNARIVRAGGSPLDVESEVARLTANGAGDGGGVADGAAAETGSWPAPERGSAAQPAQRDERELEIRQMLEARSARIVRNGGQPLDIEAEVAKLLDGAAGAS